MGKLNVVFSSVQQFVDECNNSYSNILTRAGEVYTQVSQMHSESQEDLQRVSLQIASAKKMLDEVKTKIDEYQALMEDSKIEVDRWREKIQYILEHPVPVTYKDENGDEYTVYEVDQRALAEAERGLAQAEVLYNLYREKYDNANLVSGEASAIVARLEAIQKGIEVVGQSIQNDMFEIKKNINSIENESEYNLQALSDVMASIAAYLGSRPFNMPTKAKYSDYSNVRGTSIPNQKNESLKRDESSSYIEETIRVEANDVASKVASDAVTREVEITATAVDVMSNGDSGLLNEVPLDVKGGSTSAVTSSEKVDIANESESFLWFKNKNTVTGGKSANRKYVACACKDIVEKNEYKYFSKYYKFLDSVDIPNEYKIEIVKKYQNADKSIKNIFNKYAHNCRCDSEYVEYDKFGNEYDAAHYSPFDRTIKFNHKYDSVNICRVGNTFFHEFAHMVDDSMGRKRDDSRYASGINNLSQFAIEDFKDTMGRIMAENGCDRQKAASILKNELYHNGSQNFSATVQDIYSGACNNQINFVWDHNKSDDFVCNEKGEKTTYWYVTDVNGNMYERNYRIGKEAFANVIADLDSNQEKTLKFITKYLPKTLTKIKEIIGGEQ